MVLLQSIVNTVPLLRVIPWGLLHLLILGACTVKVDLGETPSLSIAPGTGEEVASPAQPATPAPTAANPSPANSLTTTVAATPDDSPRLLADGITLSPSNRYQNQSLSPALFEEIPWWGEACKIYPAQVVVASVCNYKREYQFVDGVLEMVAYGTEGAGAVFRPDQPMTVQAAKDLGWILSRGQVSQNNITEENDQWLVFEDTDHSGAGANLTLELKGGEVVHIAFQVWTP
ncbi:hypothetical protein VB712_04595 [Spirulina sp. CCNP1310]|uniref:hypothetical protein n=1 Tax=Spirulina sp. CCNP1310 TaxID=3110249 RepID=UPI002B20CAF6|nr:hypothetical protein [Spirulina sp. CCNP1310]MEA5418494.1 hypothetical protein [Spirulina sp. CCNP1310]